MKLRGETYEYTSVTFRHGCIYTGQNVVQCVTKETSVRVSSKQLMAYTGGWSLNRGNAFMQKL